MRAFLTFATDPVLIERLDGARTNGQQPERTRTWRSTLDDLTASESDPNGECRLDIKRKLPRITWQKQDMRFKPWGKAYGARIQQKFFLLSFKLTIFARLR